MGVAKKCGKQEKISNDNITNVVLYFKNKSIKKIQLKYFFDGKNFELKSNRYSKKSEKRKIISELESDRDILLALFSPFETNIMDKEHIADNFATEDRYKARIRILNDIDIISLESIWE